MHSQFFYIFFHDSSIKHQCWLFVAMLFYLTRVGVQYTNQRIESICAFFHFLFGVINKYKKYKFIQFCFCFTVGITIFRHSTCISHKRTHTYTQTAAAHSMFKHTYTHTLIRHTNNYRMLFLYIFVSYNSNEFCIFLYMFICSMLSTKHWVLIVFLMLLLLCCLHLLF